jgi:uncharacterized membrane protein YcaP (DUF421 family)
MNNIMFESWESLFRTIIIAVLAYVVMVFFLRASGKRTLSKMNAFDFIITVALGSAMANVILNKNVVFLDGVAAFFMLIFLQYITTYFSVRSRSFNNMIKSTPSLLVYKGRMLKPVMQKERITEDEIFAIVREKGFSSVHEPDAIILETDGSLTCIKNIDDPGSETLQAVKHSGEMKKD